MPPLDKQQFVAEQKDDPVLGRVYAWVEEGQRQTAADSEDSSKELLFYWARFESLSLNDGVLCFKQPNDDDVATIKVVVPRGTRHQLLTALHSETAHF